jgi:hypothetical protein
MKNYLKSVLVILLIVSFTDLCGQIKSGYMFGLNLSSMTYRNKGVDLNPETWAGIHFGGLFEFPVAGGFTLQSGALFSAKSTGYEIDSAQYSIGPIFIEVPVRAVFSLGSSAFKVSFFAGPYMKPFDVGFNFGAGVNIHGLLITAQYGLGMVNLAPVRSDNSEMKNRVVGISFASLFSGKK